MNISDRHPGLCFQYPAEIYNTHAAELIVPALLKMVPSKSVLDVGCGIGTWLTIVNKYGIGDIVGIDGHNVDRSRLLIGQKHFLAVDLRQPFQLNRQFDVALCLEVAEHIPASSADTLVQSLCNHSSIVVFSAAIPGQGGAGHINEQWPAYWVTKFKRHGYERLDLLRPLFWNDARINVWYRQNLFVFSRDVALNNAYRMASVPAEVHPDLWTVKLMAMRQLQNEVDNFDRGGAGLARSFRALIAALKNKLRWNGR